MKRVSVILILVLAGAIFAIPDLRAAAGRLMSGYDLIYPQPKSKLRFSHAAHASHDCLVCHPGVPGGQSVAERHLPGENVCATCHADLVRKVPNEMGTAARCAYCHEDFDPSGESRPSRADYPTARIRFAHNKHVQAMVDCSYCHSGITVSEKSGGRHYPDKPDCINCHKEKQAKTDCATCHPTRPSGELTTSFNGDKLIPLKGRLNHQRDWNKRHAQEVAYNPLACRDCHQQRFCNTCHDGVKKPMAIHPEDYVTTHPIDARKHADRCNACHRFQSSCNDCHRKMGATPDATRKSKRLQIHPPGFGACLPTPDHHSFQAKRNLAACVSCHREDDCLKCHRSGSTCGGSVNIHGHMSTDQLNRMEKKNPRACRKCHANAN